jgi:hypothetical protein
MLGSLRSYFAVKALALLWLAYALWNSTLSAMPNLSLYTREGNRKRAKGIIRFNYGIALRIQVASRICFRRIYSPMGNPGAFIDRCGTAGRSHSVGLDGTWIFLPAGLWLDGSRRVGGAYFPNYIVFISPAEKGARNLSLLGMATPVASL